MNQIKSTTTNRLLSFDFVRNVAILSIVIIHAVSAYSTVTPHWPLHDGSSVVADIVRMVFDTLIMPIFFFVAGYFGLASLQRKDVWPFLKSKLRRIGIPWLLAIFILIPLLDYLRVMNDGSNTSFLAQWLMYLKQAGTLRAIPLSSEGINQWHYWFLSLILSFFFAFSLFYSILKGRKTPRSTTPRTSSNRSILQALLLTGALTSAGYFVTLLFIPKSGWVAIDLFLIFKPTDLVLYIAYFALGVYAYSKRWFVDGKPLDYLKFWAVATVLLTIGFLPFAQVVFANPTVSHTLSPGLLLAFSLTRSFLCLAFLVTLMSYALQYWNSPSPFNQKLAAHSYNIYLVHFIFVIIFQEFLMLWQGGPPIVKAGIVFLLSILISIGISSLIKRFPRGFVGFLVALFVLVIAATL